MAGRQHCPHPHNRHGRTRPVDPQGIRRAVRIDRRGDVTLKTRTEPGGSAGHLRSFFTGANREVLGVRIGDSESEAFWRETFRCLKERGLANVAYVVSDDHNGLVSAAWRCFAGANLTALSGALHAQRAVDYAVATSHPIL